jgi:hypothetical protein
MVLALILTMFAIIGVTESYAARTNIVTSGVADALPYPELPGSVIPNKDSSGGSIINLIMSAFAMLCSIALVVNAIICYRRKKNCSEIMREVDDGCTVRDYSLRDMGIVFGFVTLFVWILVDEPFERMVWVNNHTVCIALLFVVHILFVAAYIIDKDKRKEGDEIRRQSW